MALNELKIYLDPRTYMYFFTYHPVYELHNEYKILLMIGPNLIQIEIIIQAEAELVGWLIWLYL